MMYDSERWDGFAFRDGDIVISTPPKCGTTWTQMICALLVFQTSDFEPSLDLISPWLDMLLRKRSDVVADLDAQTHRRFVKTHTPLDGLPFDEHVTYVCVGRDPRDVALSWDNHMANVDFVAVLGARADAVGLDDIADQLAKGPPERLASERERFWEWVDGSGPEELTDASLASTLAHLGTFWSVRDWDNVVILHYDDLQADRDGQMRMLAGRLGIDVPEDRWPVLVEAAGFDHMHDNADRVAPATTDRIWQDNQNFFHRGTSGQWRALLDDADLRRYAERVAELGADPALVEWVHRGPIMPHG